MRLDCAGRFLIRRHLRESEMKKSVRIALFIALVFMLGLFAGIGLRPLFIKSASEAAANPAVLEGVPDVRQSTTYSCGAAALQALLCYWGIDKREGDLMRALETSEEEGTSPEAIVRVAKEVGCKAYSKEDLGLKDIEESLRQRIPVICAIQAWADIHSAGFSWDKAWEDGHYVIVIGLDSQSVYVEDPSLLGTRGFIPRDEFLARWHDYRGEPPYDPSDQPYIHLGIFVIGQKATEKPNFTRVE
jgi:predicted double-glycine peptidase